MVTRAGNVDPHFEELFSRAFHGLPNSQKQPERRLLRALRSAGKSKTELIRELGDNVTEQYVAVNLNRLRTHLDKFFDKHLEGMRTFQRIELLEPDGDTRDRYELSITRNPHPVAQFWDQHGSLSDPVYLVWAEPLVFYDDSKGHRTYVRYLDLNDPGNVPKSHPAYGLRPCYGYQSSGDIESVYLLEKAFAKLRIGAERRLIRGKTQDAVIGRHAVVIGNSRMNPQVGLFQRGLDFKIEADHAKLDVPRRERLLDYVPIPELEKQPAYVVLTRAPLDHKKLTMISGNQGRAIQRVIEALVKDELLERVWNHIGGPQHNAWPSKFQVLFEVAVQRNGFVDHYEQAKPKEFKIYPDS
jgi:hypothetical protein